MKTKKALIPILLSFFFLSSYGNAWKNTCSFTTPRVLREDAIASEDPDEYTILEEAISNADESIRNLVTIEGFNAEKEYVNCVETGEVLPLDSGDVFIDVINTYCDYNPETIDVLRDYSYEDVYIDNLYLLCSNQFGIDCSDFEDPEEYVIDQGMLDCIKKRNGTFINEPAISEEQEILNPEYMDVYSVYESVIEEKEEGEEEDGGRWRRRGIRTCSDSKGRIYCCLCIFDRSSR